MLLLLLLAAAKELGQILVNDCEPSARYAAF